MTFKLPLTPGTQCGRKCRFPQVKRPYYYY
ncbi:hypothetical protein BH18GEM1_BH18GEM1_09850 [soil metagenome]